MDTQGYEAIRRIIPAAFYRPNKPAKEDWIVAQGGSPGTRSKGDWVFFFTEVLGRIGIGGNRAGKSTKLILLMLATMLGFFPWVPKNSPWRTKGLRGLALTGNPSRCRYVLPNFGMHLPEVMKEWDKWCPRDWWNVSAKSDMGQTRQIRLFNNSEAIFMSHKQDEEDFEGIEADLNLWDEPPPDRRRWIALNRGLVSTGGCWAVGATMLDSSGWYWDEVIIPNMGDENPNINVTWHSIWDNTAENGGCSTQTVENVLSWLNGIVDPDERLAREHGHPMHFGGLVLSKFSDSNIVAPFELPDTAQIISAIDPAGARPFACLHIAYIPDESGKWTGHVFDETYLQQGQKDLKDFCEVFKMKERGETDPKHPKPSIVTFIDPFAEEPQKADSAGRSIRRILFEDYGIQTTTVNRQGKRARLMQLNARVGAGDYKVWSNCRRLLTERRRWSWAPDRPKLTEGMDDLCDCWSYIDGSDPGKILGMNEGEEVGGIWKPEEYRDREDRARKIRKAGNVRDYKAFRDSSYQKRGLE